ncbi:MAG: hypothetical protein H6Q89_1476, partial [Myxococcaceae bacterium]|nr:hypothetical protein [Myxococcaceae bacterium]
SGAFSYLAVASAAADCADNDADVFQPLSVARDVDQDGTTLTATLSSQCVGTTSVVNGRTYYADSAGAFTWLATASAAADCLDSDPDVFQSVSVIADVDQDGYGASTSSVASRCVGNTSLVGGRTYYRSATGANTWLQGSQNLGADCNDGSATVLGTTNYYADVDGDGFGTGAAIPACTQPAATSLNNTDCNDGSAFVNVNRSVFDDTDQDGFTEGAVGTQCSGVASTVNGRTYYRAASGAYTWILTSLGADCDDAVAAVTGPVDWYADVDGDSFGTGTATNACTAPVGKPVRNNTDCNDASANVFTNRFVYPDADQDGYTDGAQATQCTGSSSVINGRTYYRNSSGGFTWITTSLGADCSTGNAALFQNVNNVVADDDRDGFPLSDFQSSYCAGATSTVGGRTYYVASAAANDYWLQKNDCINYQTQAGGHCLAPFDCYDLNSAANPVQTTYFTTSRGDGSFDYNCSGAATSNSGVATYCVSAGSATIYTDATCTAGAVTATRCGSTPALALPAACGLFDAVGGGFYFDTTPTCVGTSTQGTTQIGCR